MRRAALANPYAVHSVFTAAAGTLKHAQSGSAHKVFGHLRARKVGRLFVSIDMMRAGLSVPFGGRAAQSTVDKASKSRPVPTSKHWTQKN